MYKPVQSIRHIKTSIEVEAPPSVCYQTWVQQSYFPDYVRNVLSFQTKVTPKTVSPGGASQDESQKALSELCPGFSPTETIKHWLVRGPEGKLYEFENKVVLDIPNKFYATISNDPNDLCAQASVHFEEIAHPERTRIELEVSFWESAHIKNGTATQLAADILDKEDSFFADCLQDFKAHVEQQWHQPD